MKPRCSGSDLATGNILLERIFENRRAGIDVRETGLKFTRISCCRLFRGCSPWRPAADMGLDRHENHTLSLGFTRADRGARDTARAVVLLRRQHSCLRMSRFQGHESLQRKDNSSPGPPSTSPSSVALPHLATTYS
ncbi:hypothetical protein AVEN_62862-1 [Araneus ventricosus]|uniref:Uncharacterized protein n=1 Tax=Araneus ventricosus TaxID=182803 RepID=A0A4Y2QV20_ARAVE|nr:hypothetical protein AVEN_62862-1 [Araneus ventricosus]